jgi:hypothetical protein
MYPLQRHRTLSADKWRAFPKGSQILMVANELGRAGHWMEKGDFENVRLCYERAFELVDLTVEDPKWRMKTRELLRFREALAESYLQKENDLHFNRLLLRTLVQLRPESAGSIGT